MVIRDLAPPLVLSGMIRTPTPEFRADYPESAARNEEWARTNAAAFRLPYGECSCCRAEAAVTYVIWSVGKPAAAACESCVRMSGHSGLITKMVAYIHEHRRSTRAWRRPARAK